MTDIVPLLQTVPFFEALSPEQLSAIADMGNMKELPAQTLVFKEGDPADALYLILKGQVRIEGQIYAGHQLELSTLATGACFGEFALADGGTRTASVQTLEACQFFTLNRADFLQVLSTSPEMMSSVIQEISKKIRSANQNFYQEVLEKQALKLALEQERHAAISQMVAGVAHAINTPMGIIKTLATLMEDQKKPADQDDNDPLNLMQTQIQQIGQLIQSFKSVAMHQVSDSLETVNLKDALEEVLTLYKMGSWRDFNTQLMADSEADFNWTGYPNLLSEVLMHLITNIETHAYPDGEGAFTLELSPTQLEAQPAFQITLTDQGLGMTPEATERAFNAFYSTRRGDGFHGLGLAIAYNMVNNALQGQLKLTSELGQGTTLTLVLPRQINANPNQLNTEKNGG